jgi:hypothetical protein
MDNNDDEWNERRLNRNSTTNSSGFLLDLGIDRLLLLLLLLVLLERQTAAAAASTPPPIFRELTA